MRRVLLVDAMAGLYRSFYSSKLTFNRHGEPVNALNRYLHLVDGFQRDYPSDDIIFCEDAPRDTLFRQQLFTEYKQGRKQPPRELLFQKSILFGFLRKIGFTVVGVNGYEADDIIGTISQTLSAEGVQVVIVSSDKDMFQLLTNDRISYLRHRPDNRTQELLFRDDIHHEFGYWPEQVIDMKLLTGDHSDNLSGIPGISTKSAVKLLQRYGSLDGIIHSEEVNDPMVMKVTEYVHSHSDVIERNREVIRIIRDIDPSLISQQIAYRVTKSTMVETMERYQVINHEEFEDMSFYPYLMGRLTD